MKKRLPALLLALLLPALCAGCSLFETEYLSIKEYQESDETESGELSVSIGNYQALRRALNAMVSRHEPGGKLSFASGYEGSEAEDLALACWALKSDTALGAYAVDYISYDLDRIVSYYEAEVFITYRRTKEETEAIVPLAGAGELNELLFAALRNGSPRLTLRMSGAGLSAEDLTASIHRLHLENPLVLPEEPAVSVEIYPPSGLDRIFEISLAFRTPPEDWAAQRTALQHAAIELASSVDSSGPEGAARLAEALADGCAYLPDGESHGAGAALVEGAAGSEDLALAYAVLCIAKDLPCVVVEGRLEQQTHYWNIITVGGVSRHVDVSSLYGEEPAVLKSDGEMGARYWWDPEVYPACEESETDAEPSPRAPTAEKPSDPESMNPIKQE